MQNRIEQIYQKPQTGTVSYQKNPKPIYNKAQDPIKVGIGQRHNPVVKMLDCRLYEIVNVKSEQTTLVEDF